MCMHAAIYLCFAVKSGLIYHRQDHWLVQKKTLKISHSLLNQPHSPSIEICIELYLLLLPKVTEICFCLYFYLQWETCLYDIGACLFKFGSLGWVKDACALGPLLWCRLLQRWSVPRGNEGSACSWKWPAADFLWWCLTHLCCLLHCQISTTWIYRMFSPHWWKQVCLLEWSIEVIWILAFVLGWLRRANDFWQRLLWYVGRGEVLFTSLDHWVLDLEHW